MSAQIITICGSTRFRADMATANRRLTLNGFIVLAPGVFAHDGDSITEPEKRLLDKLHLEKIDLSAGIFVVNPGGYIGESTTAEIAYTRAAGKFIWSLVPLEGS